MPMHRQPVTRQATPATPSPGAPDAAQQQPRSSVVMAETEERKAGCSSTSGSPLATDHTLQRVVMAEVH